MTDTTEALLLFRASLEAAAPGCVKYKPSAEQRAASVIAEALAAKDARIAEVREQVALLYVASGCSCCRDDKGWYAASARLGDLLNAPRYDDDTEQVDWYAVRDEYAALETKHG